MKGWFNVYSPSLACASLDPVLFPDAWAKPRAHAHVLPYDTVTQNSCQSTTLEMDRGYLLL